jgi:hypothetical protein
LNNIKSRNKEIYIKGKINNDDFYLHLDILANPEYKIIKICDTFYKIAHSKRAITLKINSE